MQPKIYNMNINLKIWAQCKKKKDSDTDPVYKDISQNIHFDVVLSVFIHPCTKKAEESSIQYSRRVDAAGCVSGGAGMCS